MDLDMRSRGQDPLLTVMRHACPNTRRLDVVLPTALRAVCGLAFTLNLLANAETLPGGAHFDVSGPPQWALLFAPILLYCGATAVYCGATAAFHSSRIAETGLEKVIPIICRTIVAAGQLIFIVLLLQRLEGSRMSMMRRRRQRSPFFRCCTGRS